MGEERDRLLEKIERLESLHQRSNGAHWSWVERGVQLECEVDTLRARVAELERERDRYKEIASDTNKMACRNYDQCEDMQLERNSALAHARRWKALAERLRKERNWYKQLASDNGKMACRNYDLCEDMQKDRDSALSDAARLREVLRKLEKSVATVAFAPHCPCCKRYASKYGIVRHEDDCALAAALKEGSNG